MGLFEELGSLINELLDFIKTTTNSELITTLATLISITITIQVIFKGYLTLAGKLNDPIREVIFDLGIKMLIAIFALNVGGWLDLVKEAMEQLHNSFSGGKNLYAVLDQKLDIIFQVNAILFDSSDLWDGTLIYAMIGIILNLISFLIGLVPAFLIMISTDITLRLILLLAPIVIFARLYGWFKDIFSQWLELFVSNLLTVYIVGILLNQFTNKYGEFLNKAKDGANGADPIAIGMQGLLYGFLLFILLKTAITVAEKIGKVSIESVGKSSITESKKDTSSYFKQFKNTNSKDK